jgi:hypothetical protein
MNEFRTEQHIHLPSDMTAGEVKDVLGNLAGEGDIERAVEAERRRIREAVEGLPKWDKRSAPGGFHVNRADVLAIIENSSRA